MKRSTDRILTTHVGSLIRPLPLQDFLRTRQGGKPYDVKAYQKCLTDSVADIVRQQAGAGIDIVTDGEIRRESYSNRFATALAGLDLDARPSLPLARAEPSVTAEAEAAVT